MPQQDSALGEILLRSGLEALPPGALEQLEAYLGLLETWNARMNLTGIRNREEMIDRHLVESVFVAQKLPEKIGSLLDVGSGAGLPGIPIAICRPEIRVSLAEAKSKKCAFLREALRETGLNCEVLQGWAERTAAGRGFDAVVMRAVERMPQVLRSVRAECRAECLEWLILMTTQRDMEQYRTENPEFVWEQPIALRGREKSVLLMGRRATRLERCS